MNPRRFSGEKGRRRVVWLVIGLSVVVVAALCVLLLHKSLSIREIRICTGEPGTPELRLGDAIEALLDSTVGDEYDIVVVETAGGYDNRLGLEGGDCELAIIQNDHEVGPGVRAITPLFSDVLHVIVRDGAAIESVPGLVGRRVATGPSESSAWNLTAQVYRYFDMAEDIEGLIVMSAEERVNAFARDELDAIFVLAPLQAEEVFNALRTGRGQLPSLGTPGQVGSELDGLLVTFPFNHETVIPIRSYGSVPTRPIGAISVQTVLVTTMELEHPLVHDLTEALFEHRVALLEHDRAIHLNEQFDPSLLYAPLHDGAEAYYRRDAPAFFMKYADSISLIMTILAMLTSCFIGLTQWLKRTKKNRIDVYYLQIRDAVSSTDKAGRESLIDAKTALVDIRTRAFSELVDERLAADQSFTIFHDYLISEINDLERRLQMDSE